MNLLLIVTFVSLVVALAMTAIAWRASREEQRRADARVASLAADIQAAAASASGAAPARPLRLVPASSEDLFATTKSSTASSRSVLVVGLGLFVFATLAALAVVFSSSARATTPRVAAPERRPPAVGPAVVNPRPLELVALGQEQKDDHLIVRGVIRNPGVGARLDHLIAVVFVFDADGGFVTSGRAPIDSASLEPGGESAFLVNIPGAEHAARYRVSFRIDTGLIPHLDNRHAS